ncbi:large ribosomal subunit protein uL4-like [Musca autumnalis]|uniref:large ribosomal subunit protein uL4-like n=1 Tax=Musca autumnalis TaxID=221902 RepID=UPI003CEB1E5B
MYGIIFLYIECLLLVTGHQTAESQCTSRVVACIPRVRGGCCCSHRSCQLLCDRHACSPLLRLTQGHVKQVLNQLRFGICHRCFRLDKDHNIDDIFKGHWSFLMNCGTMPDRRRIACCGPFIVYCVDESLCRDFRNIPRNWNTSVDKRNLLKLAHSGFVGRFVIWESFCHGRNKTLVNPRWLMPICLALIN